MFSVGFSLASFSRQGFQFGSACACQFCVSPVVPRLGFCGSCGAPLPFAGRGAAPAPASPGALVAGFSLVGFSGSRACPFAAEFAARAVAWVRPGASVFVGCAQGVDRVVRSAFAGARVFNVGAYQARGAASRFARRSQALVRGVQAGGGLLIVCPAGPCPPGVAPGRAFIGGGSGSWASAAFAVGLGVPVLLWPGPGALMPYWALSAGYWVGPCLFIPSPVRQGSLL